MNLDDFIEKRKCDGTLDSVGDFSIDSLSAFRKLLASSLPEPHFYLFQLIQGLVQSRVENIRVAIGRRENKITFDDPQELFSDLDRLAERFRQGLSVSSNDPFDLLMSGMVTSLGSHVTSAELHYGSHRLAVCATGVTQSKLMKAAKSPSLILRRTLEKGLSFSWSRIWGARKEEFRVRKAFEHSPVPLSIAGLPTRPHSAWRRGIEGDGRFALLEAAVLVKAGQANHCGEPQPLGAKLEGTFLYPCDHPDVATEDLDLAMAPDLLMMACNEVGEPRKGFIEPAAWNRRKWTICFTSCDNEKVDILFVRNGVNLDRHEVDLGLKGLHIVAPADDLAVDATGYRLVQNEAYYARIAEVKELIKTILASLKRSDVEKALGVMGHEPEQILQGFDWL